MDPRTTIRIGTRPCYSCAVVRGSLVVVVLAASVVACASIAGLQDPDPVVAIDPTVDGGPSDTDGGGDVDNIEVTPAEIDFGEIPCGTESGNVPTFLVRNKGTKPVHYTVQVPDGSAFEVRGPAPFTGDLAPGATATLSAVVKPTILGDNSTAITISTANAVEQITLKAKGSGGKLEIVPSIADFGQVRYQNDSTLDIAFKNTGTGMISVNSIDGANADFDLTWTKPLPLLPNEQQNVTVKLKAGTVDTMASTMLVPHVDGALCGSVPNVPVKGARVSQDVTISPADFGKVFCNSAPSLQKDVVISNYTLNMLTYATSLRAMASSKFNIVNAGPGTIAAGNTTTPTTAKITLSMKAVGATLAPISEVLDINTSGVAMPSGGARTAAVTADVRGIVLTVNPTSANFYRSEIKNYSFTNTGNETFTTFVTYARDPGSTQHNAWGISAPASVGPGATAGGQIQFSPSYCGNYAGQFTFSDTAGTPICNGVPGTHVAGSTFNNCYQ